MATPRTPETSVAPVLPLGTLPEVGYVRQPQVLAVVPFSSATLWRRVKAGTFPKPVKISRQVTVWRVEDVRAFLATPTFDKGVAA